MLKGAVAGTSSTGPRTDGRTGARTPDDDERQPMVLTTRPSMPLAFYTSLCRGGGGLQKLDGPKGRVKFGCIVGLSQIYWDIRGDGQQARPVAWVP